MGYLLRIRLNISRILRWYVQQLGELVVMSLELGHLLFPFLLKGKQKIDASQHFRTRANASSSKGVFGVTPNESPNLAKAMGDIASVLKDIREGQQNLLNVQRQQTSQVEPPKHSGICACTSHFTDECPQLQEDHTIAATHNFYDKPSVNHVTICM
ncbi:hypothetical protein PIB30_056190 [Stylosanthes scabra]|uniref:Uncharacterized protein n=1 Tax=Stylosanthes scabra TaxID=79078 RepID=A0ABU6VHG7_9FABA|nr:hypothetical protein [Stylosanthes scabra]